MGGRATSGASRRRNPTNDSKTTKSYDEQDEIILAPPSTPMGSMGPVAPKHPDLICPHLSYVRLEKMKRKILTPTAWSCSECGTTEGVWACLTCGKIGCGRYQSEHALSHYEDYQHPLALEINLSYCYCYQCDQYVTQDNKKEELETIRKLILKAQTVDDGSSTTRSGKAIRPPAKIPTNSEFKDEDRLHTAVKHWRLLTQGKAFNSWKTFISGQRRKKQLNQLDSQSPELICPITTTHPSSPSPPPSSGALFNFITPPPVPRATKASFLTQSTQRALASPSSRRIIPGITGLRNLGNTCFMNTVLQALSNTSEFRDFFVHMLGATQPKEEEIEEVKEKETKNRSRTRTRSASAARGRGKEKEADKEVDGKDEAVVSVVLNGKRYTRQPTLQLLDTIRKHVPKLEEVSLAMEVHSLLRVLWSGKWAVVTPCALLESVWKFVPKFRNRQQQDAQEFLCYLFDRLQLELSHANSALGPAPAPALAISSSSQKAKETNSDVETDKNTRRKRGRSPSPPPATLPPIPLSGDEVTIITETFQGKLCSVVTCDTCKHASTKLEPFLDLSVDIPVVSLARPYRRKRKTKTTTSTKTRTKTKTRTRAKTKTKQNGVSKAEEDPPPSPPSSPPPPPPTHASTPTDRGDTATDKMDEKTDNATKTNRTSTDTGEKAEESTAIPVPPTTSTPSSSTPPTSSNSDSDTEHGPLSCNLSDCLSSFIKEERVEGYACVKCEEKREASKRLYLHSLPHVLCIVLKRFAWTATSRSKIDTHVTIPFTLDVSDYMLPTASQDSKEDQEGKQEIDTRRGMYELRSVVMHHGAGLLSGHYTSFCYNELQDTWVHYNDARVNLITREQVERDIPSQAYLMFYQRTSPPSSSSFLPSYNPSNPSSYAPLLPLLPSMPPPSLPPSPPTSPYAPPPAANLKAKRLKR